MSLVHLLHLQKKKERLFLSKILGDGGENHTPTLKPVKKIIWLFKIK